MRKSTWSGKWRWRNDARGQEFGFMGEMLEVELHSKLVYTQIYDPGSIITVTFTETNGITDVATLMKYASLADRDASMSTGMADGMEQSFQALDGVLTS